MATERKLPSPRRVAPALPLVRPQRAPEPDATLLQLPRACRVLLLPDVPARDVSAAPNLLPLLALWLAREGAQVLVHRPGAPGAPHATDTGAGAAAVLASLGIPPARDAGDVADRWARREPAVLASALLAPASLPGTDWRFAMPRGPGRMLHLVPCEARADKDAAAAWARRHAATMLRLAGPWPADPRRCPDLDVWIDGRPRAELGAAAADDPTGLWTPMPHHADATAMALFVQDVLSGVRPLPRPLRELAERVGRIMDSLTPPLADAPVSCL